jgi:hypothetical protein
MDRKHPFANHPIVKTLAEHGFDTTHISTDLLGPGGGLLHGHHSATVFVGGMPVGYLTEQPPDSGEWEFQYGTTDLSGPAVTVRPEHSKRRPVRREHPVERPQTLFVASCTAWQHPPDDWGVTPEGVWFGPLCTTETEAQTWADGHEHTEAQVTPYTAT